MVYITGVYQLTELVSWCTTQYSSSTEGVFLNVIGTKILRLMLHAIHSHLPADFTPDLRFLQATAEKGGGLALFTLSLYLPVKVALYFLLLLFI